MINCEICEEEAHSPEIATCNEHTDCMHVMHEGCMNTVEACFGLYEFFHNCIPVSIRYLHGAYEKSWRKCMFTPVGDICFTTERFSRNLTTCKEPITLKRKKRRRCFDDIKQYKWPLIISPTCRQWSIPQTVEAMPQTVINALAMTTPIDVRLKIFGYWHSMIVVSIFYRARNLSMLMIKRGVWDRVFLSSHCVIDALHIFEHNRYTVQWDHENHIRHKWVRQSFPNIVKVYNNKSEYVNRKGRTLKDIPTCISRCENSASGFQETCEALMGNDTFKLTSLRRMTPVPFTCSDSLPYDTICGTARACTAATSLPCISRVCQCKIYLNELAKSNINQMNCNDAIQLLWQHVPSAISSPVMLNCLKPLIDFCRSNPKYVFLPQGDAEIEDHTVFNSYR